MATAGIVIAAILFPASVVVCSFPVTLNLERAIPPLREIPLNHLKARDNSRHGRKLEGVNGLPDGVVSPFVLGTWNPYVIGLYFTPIYFGPGFENLFVDQIDTRSDALWVACAGCKGCPRKSGMKVELKFYDHKKSNTSTVLSCSDKQCRQLIKAGNAACNSEKNQCSYKFEYGDESTASGYYIEDMMTWGFQTHESLNYSGVEGMLFGCSTKVTGELTKTSRAVDGIFGLGRGENSVISQLASKGVTPYVFSHCLGGADYGGGTLVFGEVIHPDIVFTPLVKDQPRYNLNLLSISVDGAALLVDSSVFATSENQVNVSETARGRKRAEPPSTTNDTKAAKVKSEAASLSAKLVGYMATMAFLTLLF